MQSFGYQKVTRLQKFIEAGIANGGSRYSWKNILHKLGRKYLIIPANINAKKADIQKTTGVKSIDTIDGACPRGLIPPKPVFWNTERESAL
jgi:hypothetical protein